MLFAQIVGQEHIKQDLRNTVAQQRISHALLLHGPEGNGALALAIAYGQYINCENKTPTDACGVCSSCIKYEKLQHPDLHFVFPVTTTTKVSKNPVSDNFLPEWRSLFVQQPYFNLDMWLEKIDAKNKQASIQKDESKEIIRKLNLKTFEARYKLMIIWLAEKMNETSANKLLKILEEPPAYTLFILVSEQPEEMLTTILSRTQIIRVPKVDKESMKKKLAQDYTIEANDLEAIVHNARGNYLRATQLLAAEENDNENFKYFTTIMRLAYAKNVPELFTLTDEFGKVGREKLKTFIEYSLSMLRENFILNQQQQSIVYLHNKEKEFSSKFYPFINERNIASLTKEFNEAYFHIERNGNAKIILFDLSLKIMMFLRV